MAENYIPTREADLLAWANNFNILLGTMGTAVGLDAGQVTAFNALYTAFADAYAVTQSDDRGPVATQTKKTAKHAMVNGPGGIRKLVGIIQKHPATTNTQREALRITIPDTEPTPIPPPEFAPILIVTSMPGRVMKIRLQNPQRPKHNKRPDGVQGATLFSYVGEEAPADIDLWKFEGSTTRTEFTAEIPVTVAEGTKVWFTAFWFNPRSQSGPPATPVFAHVQYGGMAAAA
jgi:hypothetical protein